MPKSWMFALQNYSYPVCLKDFEFSSQYSPFFADVISGNRASTMEFENRFRENTTTKLEVYYEVLFWKLYSQPKIRNRTTARVIRHMENLKIVPNLVWDKISLFVKSPSIYNLRQIRLLFGFTAPVIAVCLTYSAFHSPDIFPMVDNQIAKWVNANYKKHNSGTVITKLIPFSMKNTSLREDDFPSYIKWVDWCRELANILTKKTKFYWRARDVEMAVFTSQRRNLALNIL
ncbi:MAG: hypothetical protein GX167_04785 [Firmicutes bacterium]|nr:hypothetical protein [Bacillota bacterium]